MVYEFVIRELGFWKVEDRFISYATLEVSDFDIGPKEENLQTESNWSVCLAIDGYLSMLDGTGSTIFHIHEDDVVVVFSFYIVSEILGIELELAGIFVAFR